MLLHYLSVRSCPLVQVEMFFHRGWLLEGTSASMPLHGLQRGSRGREPGRPESTC
jgi:hypothetical protein